MAAKTGQDYLQQNDKTNRIINLKTKSVMEYKYDVFISYSSKDYLDDKGKEIPGNIISGLIMGAGF